MKYRIVQFLLLVSLIFGVAVWSDYEYKRIEAKPITIPKPKPIKAPFVDCDYCETEWEVFSKTGSILVPFPFGVACGGHTIWYGDTTSNQGCSYQCSTSACQMKYTCTYCGNWPYEILDIEVNENSPCALNGNCSSCNCCIGSSCSEEQEAIKLEYIKVQQELAKNNPNGKWVSTGVKYLSDLTKQKSCSNK